MTQSKAWDWKKVRGKSEQYWLEPSQESYYLINRWLAQGKKDFLDLGCGLGRHAIQFAKAGFNTSGFDLSETSIARTAESAAQAGLSVDLKVGDMLQLPYSDDSFDCIICYNVISHTDTKGIKQIIAELRRVLRADGECFLTLCSKQSWGFLQDWPKIDANTKTRLVEGPEYGVPHFYADYDLIIELFAEFEIVKAVQLEEFFEDDDGETSSSYHYHVLLRK